MFNIKWVVSQNWFIVSPRVTKTNLISSVKLLWNLAALYFRLRLPKSISGLCRWTLSISLVLYEWMSSFLSRQCLNNSCSLCGQCNTLWEKVSDFADVHRVSKNKQNYFCYNYDKLPPNLTIFGTMMANWLELYEVHSFSTSPNSRQCTTV